MNTALQCLTATAHALPCLAGFLRNAYNAEEAVHECFNGWCLLCAVREIVNAAGSDTEAMEVTGITSNLSVVYNQASPMSVYATVRRPLVRRGAYLVRVGLRKRVN